MEWVADHLSSGDRVVVATDRSWSEDAASEWFPALTRRLSVATVQGSEWTGNREFERRVNASRALVTCISVQCLRNWSARLHAPFDVVFVPKSDVTDPDPFAALRASLYRDATSVLLYDGPGASIFRIHAGENDAPLSFLMHDAD